jgi:hypothetical protein
MPDFASFESQEVREYWEHETQEFTPWIAGEMRAEDVSELEDSLGLDLEIIEEEKSVGRYNVDILAEVVDDNRNVVVENQLSPSDHDHLGKSIAYAPGVDGESVFDMDFLRQFVVVGARTTSYLSMSSQL